MRTGRFYESFPVTAFLLLINLAWFGLEVIQHLKYNGALPRLGGWVAIDVKVLRLLGALSWKELERGEYWRIVSCAFLHGGVIHILFNGLMLSDLGRSCEPLLSRWKFLVAYGIGILGSAAGSMTSGQMRGLNVVSVGASGAVCSLIGLLLVYSIKERQREVRNTLLHSVVWIIASSFLLDGIDHGAHLGGFLAGAVFGLTVKDYVTSQEAPRWRYPGYAVATLGLVALGMTLWNYFAKR